MKRGKWVFHAGAGAHTNFSTKSMREKGGLDVIMKAVKKLKMAHAEHIISYGDGNERRLTGKHETASIDKFTSGQFCEHLLLRPTTDCPLLIGVVLHWLT